MKKQFILIITALIVVSACAQDQVEFTPTKFTETEGKKDFLVTIHTSMGDMKAILYDETPLHRDNFLKLAQSGQYDSTIWHRVISEFMIQGGGVDMKDRSLKNELIPAEFDARLFHVKGALAAARSNNPAKSSSWCQFYIVQGKTVSKQELTLDLQKLNQGIGQLCQKEKYIGLREQLIELQSKRDYEGMNKLMIDNANLVETELGVSVKKEIAKERLDAYTTIGGVPHLDDIYTVFGQVVEGFDVIDKIAEVKTARGDKPLEDLYLTVEVEELSKKKIAKRYGVIYIK